MVKSARNSYKNSCNSCSTVAEQQFKDVSVCTIWNYDETNLRDDPGARKNVMKRDTKCPEKVMDSSKVAFSVMFLLVMLKVMFCHHMLFTNLCIFMTSGLKVGLLVPDKINPKLVGLMKPHSQMVFQNNATKVVPPRRKEIFD